MRPPRIIRRVIAVWVRIVFLGRPRVSVRRAPSGRVLALVATRFGGPRPLRDAWRPAEFATTGEAIRAGLSHVRRRAFTETAALLFLAALAGLAAEMSRMARQEMLTLPSRGHVVEAPSSGVWV